MTDKYHPIKHLEIQVNTMLFHLKIFVCITAVPWCPFCRLEASGLQKQTGKAELPTQGLINYPTVSVWGTDLKLCWIMKMWQF